MKKATKSSFEVTSPVPATNSLKRPSNLLQVHKYFGLNKTPFDHAQIRVRNPLIFKIKFLKFPSLRGTKRILKRNMKHLKGTKDYQFKPRPSFDIWKNLKKIKKLDQSQVTLNPLIKNPSILLKKFIKLRIAPKQMNLELTSLTDFVKRKRYVKELRNVHVLKLSSWALCSYFQVQDSIEKPQLLINLKFFTHLQSLFIEIPIQAHTSKPLLDIFELLSDAANNLISLKITMSLIKVDKVYRNMAKILEKFTNLQYLHFCLGFWQIPHSSNLFTSFTSFPALKHLNLELTPTQDFDYDDAIKFISAYNHLITLKIQLPYLPSHNYQQFLNTIRKLKSLSCLCVLEKCKQRQSLQSDGVLKILEALEKLRTLKLDVVFNPLLSVDKIKPLVKSMLQHPSLEKVSTSLHNEVMRYLRQENPDLQESIKKLKKKLRSFNTPVFI